MTEALRRDRFRVALVGRPAVEHAEMIRRAGYRVVSAETGADAGRLFGDEVEPYDALVIDFALEGRPPEAVLLFGRRSSPDAPVVALVPGDADETYRRAFLAGARDVLACPARGEDLLAAIDIVLEPRALSQLVDELRAQIPIIAQTAWAPEEEDELLIELEELREKVNTVEARERRVTDQFRVQALEAVTARDELHDQVRELREQIAVQDRELREARKSSGLNERAATELQIKLKDLRDQRRSAEERAARAETRMHELEIIQEVLGPDTLTSDVNETDVWDLAADADPEDMLRARRADEEKLDELERALEEKALLDRQVVQLEDKTAPSPAEADRVRRQRDLLEARVLELETQLSERETDGESLRRMKRTLQDRDDRILALQRQRDTAEDLLAKMVNVEDELTHIQRDMRKTSVEKQELSNERETLATRVRELELEIADAQMRLDEESEIRSERDQLTARLRAERESHALLRDKVRALESKLATQNDETETTRRALVLARARAESQLAEMERLKNELALERTRRELGLGSDSRQVVLPPRGSD